ncbi:hypothetical protein JQS43_10120 [Natronosporangium hydrolyticum]|uniref:Uncharacterized protein n=1 Tax=Natronosporangium hydrolyticum TaxID=2811111 RepID=A0A895YGA1_9ACTN|nr:DUF6790 family protein [Natronosporangium hydrolyticum]QSB16591.1 hypothetical protein JQS43_10120 [Natronosporangium hydrolyticum]
MVFFVGQWALIVVGFVLHLLLDRHPDRRTGPRAVELALLWVLVAGGAWAIIGGIAHIGPNSTEIADQIGYEPSMFQWEVGWGDIALGVLGIGCALRRLRGSWLTAAVVALAISYFGDAIGHLMQLVAHDNRAPSNVWSLPSDILQPLLAIGLLIGYRRTSRRPEPRRGRHARPDSG